jgi:hypothetical protein
VTNLHSQAITSVSVHPLGEGGGVKFNLKDSRYVLTNSRDDSLKLVDIRMYEALRTFKYGAVSCLKSQIDYLLIVLFPRQTLLSCVGCLRRHTDLFAHCSTFIS